MSIPVPRTLKVRAITIFCAVFLFSQLASLLLFEHNRDKAIILAETADLADRIIGIVGLARGFPPEDRNRILAAAETQFLTMFPEVVSIEEVACQDNDFSRHMSSRISAAFGELPDFSAQVCVRGLDTPQLLKADNGLRGFDVLVFINFPDSEQTVFHTVLPAGTPLLEDTVIVYFALVGLLALLLAWLLIQRATAPLERLARAADDFGATIDSVSLNEDGPLEVARAAKAFNRMQTRLSLLIKNQTEMLAAVSHDLRSAVTRLQLRAELLPDSDDRNGLLRGISDMNAMIKSMLEFVRGYNPSEPLRNVNIAALVESLCEDMRTEGFPVTCHCPDIDVNIVCRGTALRRGLQNIIDNAIKYGEAAEVTLTPEPQRLVIGVDDRGPGIPDDQLKAVLEPFYRLDRARNQESQGMGLGLAITQNIVQTIGGELVLSNRAGGGLRVEIRVPLTY
ncbi:MAG: hypothetical protein CMK32_01460 [Porticoccaceae bacterium]|nr:hypothetical protein [Porticoccaceae bacterium]